MNSHKGDTYTDITEKENGEIRENHWRFCCSWGDAGW